MEREKSIICVPMGGLITFLEKKQLESSPQTQDSAYWNLELNIMKTFSLSWFLNPVKTTLLACLHQTFPPVVSDTDTYCSMLLSNMSTSLITFTVNQTACPSVLVKPSSGYIIPEGHQIFFLSTHPVNTVLQKHVLPLELNSYPAYTKVRRGKWKMASKVLFPCSLLFSQ